MHSCVGRIRYLGVMLYDADQIQAVASCDESEIVDRHMDIYLNPNDPAIIKAARENGIADSTIKAAQSSPVYKFVKEWKIALPLHPEFRTLPNLFYVPPLLPAMASVSADGTYDTVSEHLLAGVEKLRVPIRYLSSLFTAGNDDKVIDVFKKLHAVRVSRRDTTVKDVTDKQLNTVMNEAGMDVHTANAIFRLTSLATFEERFVIPAAHREEAIEMLENTGDYKGSTGFGFKENLQEDFNWFKVQGLKFDVQG